MLQKILSLTDDIIHGKRLDAEEATFLLDVSGSDLSAVLAGADRLREHFFDRKIEVCSIINAKSGRCSENCAFCAQSAHHQSDVPVYPLKSSEEIIRQAKAADAEGSHCFGIVTSGTRVEPGREFDDLLVALRQIKVTTSLDPSASLGLLTPEMARALSGAGCVTYHHNLETARSFFPQICTTHAYDEDIETIRIAKAAGMRVCSGGILGLGESPSQRIELALTLRELDVDSIPLNFLNPIDGTPLAGHRDLAPLDCVRIIALFRYLLPDKKISVCGGREPNLREFQSWIFMAGATGTMMGNYLTTSGRNRQIDLQMLLDTEMEFDAC